MKRERFQLALERLESPDWAKFEVLSSVFLASEFPNLRTVASPSGDRGRDSELFANEGDAKVLFQYSVTKDWTGKVRATVKRIKVTFPDTTLLIYVTNQQIGAKADQLKAEFRKINNLYLDIRDISWFLDRMDSSDERRLAAERLAEDMVDPLLKDRKIIEDTSRLLDDTETRAAYLYLSCQLEDESKEKGLTKLSYEALIRSVLRETSSDKRLMRDKIKEEMRKILSSHPADIVDKHTESALIRMTKKYIRHWTTTDEFCLTHEEMIRLSEEIAKHDKERQALNNLIKDLLLKNLENGKIMEDSELMVLSLRIEKIVEKYLNSRGEKFATAVTTGKMPGLAHEDLKTIITTDLSGSPLIIKQDTDIYKLFAGTINELFCCPTTVVTDYLRSVADTYTLMAFLRETPDVQSSVKKIFSHGEIWLDTSIVLPLFAEQLIEDDNKRYYTRIMNAAQKAGMKLKIIEGIVEEINGHLNKCLACARMPSGAWKGDVPFILSVYVLSGRDVNTFASWVENYKGDLRPDSDMSEYLKDIYHIETDTLEKEAEKADVELRGAVQEIWHETHERRKKRKVYEIDDLVMHKLVRHDVENYLGVIYRRKAEKASPLGYSTWWLTLDSKAHILESILRGRISTPVPISPVLSLDFLANYLSFGPLRRSLKDGDHKLPIFIDRNFIDYIPSELLDVARQVRKDVGDLPEHVVRRKVRDHLEIEKRKIGKLTKGGAELMQARIEAALEDIPLEG